MSQRVFEIDELPSLISCYLDPKSAASLACTCRCLEVPALSFLWAEYQTSLVRLANVLPAVEEVCVRFFLPNQRLTYLLGNRTQRFTGQVPKICELDASTRL